MNKVTAVNLNGRAYQMEEAGYEALRRYLDQAGAKLEDNPDKDEIMADFEQAIADKCDEHLGPHKNVVTAEEVETIIAKMGPVDANAGAVAAGAKTSNTNAGARGTVSQGASKCLYRLREGAWIAGVCNGLAAYLNIDVTVIRVLFVTLIAISHGFGGLLYILLWIVMPIARTDEQLAEAHGAKPFNAHDFIEQAKTRYHGKPAPEEPAAEADRDAWKKWKHEMRQWKHEWRNDMRRERAKWRSEWREQIWQYPAVETGRGFFRFIMGLILAAIFVFWVVSLWTILTHGTFLGFATVTAGHPLWLSLIFVCALCYIIALPFKLLSRNARPWKVRPYNLFIDIVESLFFIFVIYLLIYTAGQLFPAVHEALGIIATQFQKL